MNGNIPKSWKFKVKGESEENPQNGLGHPSGNEVFGTHSREHPNQESIYVWA